MVDSSSHHSGDAGAGAETNVSVEINPVDALLTEDLACRHCGYNLRGLTHGARCPECSAAVAESLREDYLRFADPEWLQKVRLGVDLVAWPCAIFLLLFVLKIIGAIFTPAATQLQMAIIKVETVMYWLLPPTISVGIWLMTTPEARLADHEQAHSWRHLARSAISLCILSSIAFTCMISMGLTWQAEFIIGRIFMVAIATTTIFLFAYSVFLLRRIPNDSLADSTKVTGRRFALFSLIGIVLPTVIGVLFPGATLARTFLPTGRLG
ncbi:MAG: hypothetical protein ACPGXK_11070, partial [Phycisphaerae bacterium]